MANATETPNPLSQPLAWDLVADGYAEEIVPLFERFAERALDLASVTRGTRVLDVAAGPGTLALVAAGRGADVTALDFSTGMMARLQERAAAKGLASAIRPLVGDAQELEFPDGSFDAVLSMFGVILFPYRARALREMARVLATGGRAVVSSWPPIDRAPLMATVFGSIRERFPLGDGPPPLGDPSEIRAELADAGLADVQVEEVTVAHEFPSTEDAWSSIARSTAPLALLRRTLGPDDARALDRKILDDLLARFGPGPVRFEAVAYLGSGVRAH